MNSRVAISHSPAFVYCRQPKAANSTVAVALYDHLNARGSLMGRPSAVRVAKAIYRPNRLSDLSRSQIEQLASSYFKFTFVRNPYTRLLSTYLNKIAPTNRVGKRRALVCNALGRPALAPISFGDFVGYLERGGLYQDPHWLPQFHLVPWHLFQLDFVGRVERINEDLRHVLVAIFGDCHWEQTQLGLGHATGANRKLEEYYTKELAASVASLYREDFDTFGYLDDLP